MVGLKLIYSQTFADEIKAAIREKFKSSQGSRSPIKLDDYFMKRAMMDDLEKRDDLVFLRCLGRGGFGTVRLAKCKESNNNYAVKILKKSEMVKGKVVSKVLYEIEIMRMLKSDFLAEYYSFFMSNSFIFIVMKFEQGGCLYDRIKVEKKFDMNRAKFYFCNVLIAMEYLHSRNIVFRDLKPENLLIGSDGYLKLTDMGLAKICFRRLYTVCGCPFYIAPEIYDTFGYDFGVDVWTMGIFLYEASTGSLPFDSKNRQDLIHRIKNMKPIFDCSYDDDAKDLIINLLNKSPMERISLKEARKHKWLSDINWNQIESKRIKAPFVPQFKDENDLAFFDQQNFEYDMKDAEENEFVEEFKVFTMKKK